MSDFRHHLYLSIYVLLRLSWSRFLLFHCILVQLHQNFQLNQRHLFIICCSYLSTYVCLSIFFLRIFGFNILSCHCSLVQLHKKFQLKQSQFFTICCFYIYIHVLIDFIFFQFCLHLYKSVSICQKILSDTT